MEADVSHVHLWKGIVTQEGFMEGCACGARRPEPTEVQRWDDATDEWSADISEAFPTRSGSHEHYATAMKMVGHRHSKGELVALVNWLLVKAERAAK